MEERQAKYSPSPFLGGRALRVEHDQTPSSHGRGLLLLTQPQPFDLLGILFRRATHCLQECEVI